MGAEGVGCFLGNTDEDHLIAHRSRSAAKKGGSTPEEVWTVWESVANGFNDQKFTRLEEAGSKADEKPGIHVSGEIRLKDK
jgi:hypothetical protein